MEYEVRHVGPTTYKYQVILKSSSRTISIARGMIVREITKPPILAFHIT